MKFTNKDLLNALGLKIGDRIKLQSEDKPQIVLIGEKYIYDYEDSLRDDLTLAIIGEVKDLVDIDFKIVKPKISEVDKAILRSLLQSHTFLKQFIKIEGVSYSIEELLKE